MVALRASRPAFLFPYTSQIHARSVAHTPFQTVSRNCLKSSWMTPYGGSSVVRNAQMGLLRAVSCAWQATDLEPIRTFRTVSLRLSDNSDKVCSGLPRVVKTGPQKLHSRAPRATNPNAQEPSSDFSDSLSTRFADHLTPQAGS